MKLIGFILVAAMLEISANVYSQTKKLNMIFSETQVKEVLKTIEEQSDFRFFYSDDLSFINEKITLNIKDQPIESVLDKILDKSDLTYRIFENNLIIITPVGVLQGISITGTVTDESGQVMPGVNVVIKGTTTGVVTGVEGKYSISAPDRNTVLQFSFMGYTTQEVTVSDRTIIDIVLNEDIQEIEEVVVMGYGVSIAKRDVIAAVSSVSAEKIAEKTPIDVLDALRGEMAGVQIVSSSGAPGADINIRVRGISTFEDGGVSPLYIVDGVVMSSISTLHPNDIKSIDVMKDAASAAIYGARAANGVVIVTTKAAEAGKPRININFTQTFGFLSNKLPQINTKEAQIFTNTVESVARRDQFQWFGTVTDSCNLSNSTSYFYQDEMTQVSKLSNLNVSISGGTDKLKYYSSAGYIDDTGIILTSYMKRVNALIKMEYTPRDFITISSNVQAFLKKGRDTNSGAILAAIQRFPQTVMYYPTDGTLLPGWASYPYLGRQTVMLQLEGRENTYNNYSANISEAIELRFTPHLRFKMQGSVDVNIHNRENYVAAIQSSTYALYLAGNDQLTLTDTNTKRYMGEAFLTYNRSFSNHNLNVMFGSSIENYDREVTTSGGRYLLNSSIRVPQASDQPTATTITGEGNSIASFFGRIDYNYKNRYMLNATMRYDGSSRFGKNNRWGFFPAVQAGWRFSDHLVNTAVADILTDGKLRFTWGRTGNDRVGNYDAQTLLTGTFANGYYDMLGVTPASQLGNTYLKWEETDQTDIGMDLLFLEGRAMLTVDYYKKKTVDLLDKESIPSELGYSTMRVNVGSIENKGWEVTVGGYPVQTKDWSWYTNINWSRNRNKVLKIAGEGGRIVETHWWVEAGKPAGQFYGFKDMGVYAYNESNAYTPDFSERLIPVFERDAYGNVKFNSEQKPTLTGYQHADGTPYSGEVKQMTVNNILASGGDVIWDDYNRDGQITDDDKQVLGKGYSDWFAGWNNTVRWKNFTLNFSFYYNYGGLIYNKVLRDLTAYTSNSSPCEVRPLIQGWRFQGQITDWYIPGQNAHATTNNRELSSFYLQDASYIRLQNAKLSYMLPTKYAEKVFVKSIQVSIFGNNLLTWTNYEGYDPELTSGGVLNPGRDNSNYPRKREFGFGLNIGF